MTKTMYIELPSIDTVRRFVNDLAKMEGDFDLISGRYVIDAKSIMGIFSLDLSTPLQMNITDAIEGDIEILKKYRHKGEEH